MLVVAVPEAAGHSGRVIETSASTGVLVSIQLVGGPTALAEIGGLRLLTDPAFDAPGPVPGGDRT